MRAAAIFVAGGLTLLSAYALYSTSIETRLVEQQVQKLERQRERLDSEIAVLKAERAHLSRPERIEPAATALGMRPPRPSNYVSRDRILRDAPASGKHVHDLTHRGPLP